MCYSNIPRVDSGGARDKAERKRQGRLHSLIDAQREKADDGTTDDGIVTSFKGCFFIG